MTSPLEFIQLYGPQFAADPRLNTLIEVTAAVFSVDFYGDRFNEAIALNVLHRLTLEQVSGGSAPGTGTSSGTMLGGVASKSEGELSVTFSQVNRQSASGGQGNLSSTQYGLDLMAIRRECSLGFRNSTI
jgi:hypothetical protein